MGCRASIERAARSFSKGEVGLKTTLINSQKIWNAGNVDAPATTRGAMGTSRSAMLEIERMEGFNVSLGLLCLSFVADHGWINDAQNLKIAQIGGIYTSSTHSITFGFAPPAPLVLLASGVQAC